MLPRVSRSYGTCPTQKRKTILETRLLKTKQSKAKQKKTPPITCCRTLAPRRRERHRNSLDVSDNIMHASRSPDHQRRRHSRATRQQREGGLVETRLGLVEDQRPPGRVAQDLQAVSSDVARDTTSFHNSCAHGTQDYRCTTCGGLRPSKRVHLSPVSGMLLSTGPTRPESCVIRFGITCCGAEQSKLRQPLTFYALR